MEKIETTKIDGLHNFAPKYTKNQIKERFIRSYIEQLGYIEPIALPFDRWLRVLPKKEQFGVSLAVCIDKDWNTAFLYPDSGLVHIVDLEQEFVCCTDAKYLDSSSIRSICMKNTSIMTHKVSLNLMTFKKTLLKQVKHEYNGKRLAHSSHSFSRLFFLGVKKAPSLNYDIGVFLCPTYYGGWILGGLLSCRFLEYGLLTRFSVTTQLLAELFGDFFKSSRRSAMDQCALNSPILANQTINKLLGRKRFNKSVLIELNQNHSISHFKVVLKPLGWVLNVYTCNGQQAVLKTNDGSKIKVFKSLDTVYEFLVEQQVSEFTVSSGDKEFSYA